MAVKSTKLNGGGTIGEVQRKRSFIDRVKAKPKKYGVIALIIFIGILFAFWLYGELLATITRQEKSPFVQEFLNSGDSSEEKSILVKKYSTQYGYSLKNTVSSSPTSWDKDKLDDAYEVLLYADKMGAYSQASAVLAQLDAAKKSGLNIDDNSYGVNQDIRDEIKSRTDERIKKAEESVKVEFKP